jgi:hypothetical protein
MVLFDYFFEGHHLFCYPRDPQLHPGKRYSRKCGISEDYDVLKK